MFNWVITGFNEESMDGWSTWGNCSGTKATSHKSQRTNGVGEKVQLKGKLIQLAITKNTVNTM